MIIDFKPKRTYFTDNTVPAIAVPVIPESNTYVDIIDDDEREYRRMTRQYRIQNIMIVLFILLLVFSILNIRISFIQTDPITGSAGGDIVLFVRCLTPPEPGTVMMTEYDFTNPEFDTVNAVMADGYVNFGTTKTDADVTINKALQTTDVFYTLCIIPLP